MALTYAQLKTEVASYLARANLTADIPGLITRGENEINRKLKGLAALESIYNATLAVNTSTITLDTVSTSLNTIIRVWRLPANQDRFEIPYLTPEQMLNQMSVASGPPKFYTVQGGRIMQFDRTADQTYSDLYVHHTTKLNIATDFATNWVALNHEELYIFASLKQAEPRIKNDKRVGLWTQWTNDIIEEIVDADRDLRGAQNAVLIPEITGYVGGRRNFDWRSG